MSDSRSMVCVPFPETGWEAAEHPSQAMALRLVLQPEALSVEVTRSGVIFGRHSGADVRLPLPDVSRRHCRFVYKEGAWEVQDLGSLNGVYVNDTRVHQASLSHRDRIRIGPCLFEVDLRQGEATVAGNGSTDAAAVLNSIARTMALPHEFSSRRAG